MSIKPAKPGADWDLTSLATSIGEPVTAAGNTPIRLDDPTVFWYVESGALDIFLVNDDGDDTPSALRHMFRLGETRLAFGVNGAGAGLAAIARGVPGSRVRRIDSSRVTASEVERAVAEQVDAWITDFGAAVAYQIEPRPLPDVIATVTDDIRTLPGQVVSTRADQVVWIDCHAAGTYLGIEVVEAGDTGLIPITSDTWLVVDTSVRLVGASSIQLSGDGRLLHALADFHGLVLRAEQLNRRLLLADEVNLQTERVIYRREAEQRARRELLAVLGTRDDDQIPAEPPIYAALKIVGAHEGISFDDYPLVRPGGEPTLEQIVAPAGVRCRKVRLDRDQRWWMGDSGAMLGFRADDGRPVALIPSTVGRYRSVDPATGRSRYVTASRAGELSEHAWFLYRPFHKGDAVTLRELVRVAGKNTISDTIRFAGAGLLAALMALVPAIVLGKLVDWAIPSASVSMLVQICCVLASFAVLGGLLQMLQGTALMRVEARVSARLAAAAWDRVLDLPPSFFQQYTAGDLLMRLSAFQTLRDQIAGAAMSASLAVIFLLPVFALLFLYSVPLAWASITVAIVGIVLTSCVGLLQVAPQRRRYAAARRISGELFQFINGLHKIRSAGAEGNAFASWARNYRQQQHARLQIGRMNEHLAAFSAALPALVGAALFAVSVAEGADGLNVADFLVIFAASLVFYRAVVGIGRSFETIAAAVPAYEQIRPILDAIPDHGFEGASTVELSGAIRFDRVSFRYDDDGPLILNDVSIHARPGEFVAVVGESGAGKSTLLRLALGLQRPHAGAVFFDDRDLEHIDKRQVRRQMGVVVQDVPLQPGNILENIIGISDDLSVDDAWRAARLADLEYDIVAMPMGMFTPVGDNAATFSGGQIQRIRIAAALVRNPRILLLDEATSWLDADSQSRVMRGIESLAATRIVIAHRLSTIRNADRIYVLQRGRVVQEGSFDELLQREGPFRALAQRQMV